MKFESLLKDWADNYFLDPLSTLAPLIGVIIFILKKNRVNTTYVFIYYFIGYILLKSLFFVRLLLPGSLIKQWWEIENLGDYIFTLFEFLIFFIYFKQVLYNTSHKKILTIVCYVLMLVGSVIMLHDLVVFKRVLVSSKVFLFNIEAVSLLIPGIFYYIGIFKSAPKLNLLQDAPFWVTTGLCFCMVSTLPFSFLLDHFYKTNPTVYYSLFDLFYIFYIILFLMIIRGYLCKPEIAK